MGVSQLSSNWVEQLPHHFYRQSPQVKAPFKTALKIAEIVDLTVRTSLSALLTGVSVPAGYSGQKIADDIEATFSDEIDNGNDEIFHHYKKTTTVHRTKAKRPLTVRTGEFEKLWWQTAYDAEHPYEQHQNNESAVAYYWRHGDRPRPTIILMHGFIAANWSINEFFLGMSFLYNLGCDVILKTLPHHGERQSPTSLVSGLDYVSGGLRSLNHAVVQSTYDVRALIDYLEDECDVTDIGLSGLSLGGYTTALVAGLEQRLKFAMPIIPIISIPDAMMEWKPLDRALNAIMDEFNLDMQQLRQPMAHHSPLNRPAAIAPEKLMIIAGVGDKMATPRHAEALQKHWGGCQLHWFEGSHALPLDRANTNAAKHNFLKRIGFI